MFTKNSRNRYDKKDSLELGQKAESFFARTAIKHGWIVEPASEGSNKNDHFDYIMSTDDKSFRVEVKSRKRMGRNDQDVQDEYVWIELHGVRKNDQGWLHGKADLIAFELKNSFRMVRRTDLLDLIEKLIDFKVKVRKSNEALYKLYSRSGRSDSLTIIKSDDLLKITSLEWKK
ncbi:MAG TPA: hypothetical protein VF896_04320 [Anaerolineales bacterium]